MGDAPAAWSLRLLKHLAVDGQDVVLAEALRGLGRHAPQQARRCAIDRLADHDEDIVLVAIDALKDLDDPDLIDRLLPLARDARAPVRRAALEALARCDDLRAVAEVLSSLHDREPLLREFAQRLLGQPPDAFPALRRHPAYGADATWWQAPVAQLEATVRWGEETGFTLLARPVRVVQYRQGFGRTIGRGKSRAVVVEVTDRPIMMGHPHAADIVKGLILHEIGHHLFDFAARGLRTTRGIAAAEGIQPIYDVLLDERLERKMRALEPGWGVCFDRLASYAFAQDVALVPLEVIAEITRCDPETLAADIAAGRRPGRLRPGPVDGRRMVALTVPEQLALPGLQARFSLFLMFLRCRRDLASCPDARVARAVAAVPADLKDLPHAGVLEVARQIGRLIGKQQDHAREQRRLRKLLERHRAWLKQLASALDHLREAGLVPGGEREGAPGIRMPVASAPLPSFARGRKGRATLPGRGGLEYDPSPEVAFDRLKEETTLRRDPDRHAILVASITRHVRVLRPYLAQLGRAAVVEGGHRQGRRPELPALSRALLRHSLPMLREQAVTSPDCYIGILIDRSGSMHGEKIARARAFAALIAESAAKLPGMAGHVNAFDDRMFVRLGDFQTHATASLESDGGNNDSGALWRAAEFAQASGCRHRLIVMISDGLPSECTFGSLQALVQHLTRRLGMVCAQVAVAPLPEVAFPHHVDLSACGFDEAVARFGKLVVRLTRRVAVENGNHGRRAPARSCSRPPGPRPRPVSLARGAGFLRYGVTPPQIFASR